MTRSLSIQNPHIHNFNQPTAKDSICEYKRLFWLTDGKKDLKIPKNSNYSSKYRYTATLQGTLLKTGFQPNTWRHLLEIYNSIQLLTKMHFVLSYYL